MKISPSLLSPPANTMNPPLCVVDSRANTIDPTPTKTQQSQRREFYALSVEGALLWHFAIFQAHRNFITSSWIITQTNSNSPSQPPGIQHLGNPSAFTQLSLRNANDERTPTVSFANVFYQLARQRVENRRV